MVTARPYVPDWFGFPEWYDDDVASGNPMYTAIIDAGAYLAGLASEFELFGQADWAETYKLAALDLIEMAERLKSEAQRDGYYNV